jgi:hypothetical protein
VSRARWDVRASQAGRKNPRYSLIRVSNCLSHIHSHNPEDQNAHRRAHSPSPKREVPRQPRLPGYNSVSLCGLRTYRPCRLLRFNPRVFNRPRTALSPLLLRFNPVPIMERSQLTASYSTRSRYQCQVDYSTNRHFPFVASQAAIVPRRAIRFQRKRPLSP